MKKILLITFIGTLFAAGSAFAHCGACGPASDAEHKETAKACCSAKAECTAEAMASCPYSGDKAACSKDAKAAGKGACTKPCDSATKTETAKAAKDGACCPATKSDKSA